MPAPGPAFSDWIASGRLVPVAELLALEFALVVAADLLGRGVSLVDGILAELHSNVVSMELMQHCGRARPQAFRIQRISGPAGARAPPGSGPQRAAGADFRPGPVDRHHPHARRRPFLLRAMADPAAARLAHPFRGQRGEVQHPLLLPQPHALAGAARARISALHRRQRRDRQGDKAVRPRTVSGRPFQAACRHHHDATTAGSRPSAPSGAAFSRRSPTWPITAPTPTSSGAPSTANSRSAT